MQTVLLELFVSLVSIDCSYTDSGRPLSCNILQKDSTLINQDNMTALGAQRDDCRLDLRDRSYVVQQFKNDQQAESRFQVSSDGRLPRKVGCDCG